MAVLGATTGVAYLLIGAAALYVAAALWPGWHA